MVLSVRNNNPGNLRPVGADAGFQEFTSPQDGLQAMRDDLLLKISGGSSAMKGRFGDQYQPTLANLITTWAPPEENDTGNYINFVAQKTGLDPNAVLQEADLDKIMPAMVEQEGGQKAVQHFYGQQPAQAAGAPSDNLIDVQMPDGTVISGVPANISKAELVDRLKKNNIDVSGFEKPAAAEAPPAAEQETAGEMDLSAPQEPAPANQSALMSLPDDDFSSFGQGALSLARRAGSAARTGFQGLTFGLGDEIQAGLAALPVSALSQLTNNPLNPGEAYDKTLDIARSELGEMRDNYPIQSIGTEIAGGIVTGGAASKAASAAAPETASALARFAAANPVKAGAGVAAATGGLYGFNEGEGGFGERAGNAAESALLSVPFGAGGGYVAGKLGNRGASVAANIADDIGDDVANAADNVATGAPMAAPSGKTSALAQLAPEQEARRSALTAVGIAPEQQTAAMLSRDPKTWQFEQNTKGINGIGDELRNRYVQANETIKGALNSLGVKTGGKATTPYEAGESITDAVISKNKEMQAEVGKLYGKIRDEVGGNPGLKPDKLFEAISEASDNAYADNVVNSMMRKLEKFGVVEKGTGAVDDAANLSVSQAEELRKFANSLRGDRQTEHIVGNIIDALDDDVIDTVGSDAFKTARDAARGRFKEFETKILNNISQGKLVSDDIINRTVYGGKVKDLQALKQSLTSGTDDQISRGAQAWNDLKLQTLQRVIDDSQSAGGKVSGAGFAKQLKKIGKERLETVFDPEELLQIRTIEKALEYTTVEVPESVVNYSGTGAANANNALSGILKSSRIGDFLEKTGDFISNAPGGSLLSVGTLGTPQALGFIGRSMKESAKRGNVARVLKPDSALRRLADPAIVGKAGVAGGVYGTEREPLRITVRPSDARKKAKDNE